MATPLPISFSSDSITRNFYLFSEISPPLPTASECRELYDFDGCFLIQDRVWSGNRAALPQRVRSAI